MIIQKDLLQQMSPNKHWRFAAERAEERLAGSFSGVSAANTLLLVEAHVAQSCIFDITPASRNLVLSISESR